MTIEELLKEYITGDVEYLLTRCNQLIHNYDLDEAKVCSALYARLASAQPKNINNYILASLKGMIKDDLDELKRESFAKHAIIPIARRFKEEGFAGSQFDREVIFAVEIHAISEFPIDQEFLNNVNEKLIDYCKSKNNTTYEFFLKWLKHPSCPLNKVANIPYEQLEQKQREIEREWNNANP